MPSAGFAESCTKQKMFRATNNKKWFDNLFYTFNK